MEERHFLLGVNYWPRRQAMYWWKHFDVHEVEEEFACIAEWGMHCVRFFVLWEDFQPRPDQIDAAQLQNLYTVMDVAYRHGLVAMPTLLVGNMSGIMWFPLWAFADTPEHGAALQRSEGQYVHRQLRSVFEDPGMLRAESLLARTAATALDGHPALHSWDLANEIDQAMLPSNPDGGWLWAWCLAQAIRAGDPDAQVTYGAHHLSLTTHGLTIPAIAPSLTYLSMHGYPIYSDVARGPLDVEFVPFVTTLTAQLGARQAMMQEFGLPTLPSGEPSRTIQDDFLGEMKPQFMASEEDQAHFYAAVLDRLWQVGASGALAWCYADYTHDLWTRPPFDRARRERTFGLVRSDGSPKPVVAVIKQFAADLRSGRLEQRLGPQGAGHVALDVNPAEYYHDPQAHFRAMYRRFLERLQG